MSIRRRDFIAGLGGAAAWPFAARAQQPERMRRIGVLMWGDENDPELKTFVSAFIHALAGLGWTDGRNVRIDLRWEPQEGDVFPKFMSKLLNHPRVKPLLSDEHFSVDGTLIEAWASHKSFRPKDGSDENGTDFHGQKRCNDTHASTTDPDSRLYRKAAGREAKLCYMGHATMENRNGLAVAGVVTHASGTAERRASERMLKAKSQEAGRTITVGEDKAYDTSDHVAALRDIGVTPHVAQNNAVTKTGKQRRSAIDGRTTRHEGYGMSQSHRAAIECIFGYGKQHGTFCARPSTVGLPASPPTSCSISSPTI